ncbi:hypothetical protein ACPXCE_09955 [Streptomyces sp. DT24]|uniref:hypothetical protein n=1 Tax=unclassified Streptomyces TaxID=2593676 RepID=UPI0023B93712|nr:hypothetical protein [Streptomyces sp. AM 4-1-1]WEH34721.1 hypothetical protein PZB75_15995 [Streptomyces sp. AM 4-1-1]
MTLFLGLGIAGVALLALSLIFDGVLEGLFGGVLDGIFDGLLSLPVIAGFVAMLGFGGAIVLGTTGAGTVAATVAGILAGLVAAWLTWKFSQALMRDQTTAAPRGSDLVGTAGSVITAIPAEGYGEVMLRLAGQPVKFSAKSPVPMPRGTEIWVEAALSNTSVSVRPVER